MYGRVRSVLCVLGLTVSLITSVEECLGEVSRAVHWHDMGLQHARNNAHELAVLNYNKALWEDPNFGESYRFRALSYMSLAHQSIRVNSFVEYAEKAIDDLSILLVLTSDKSGTLVERGDIYRNIGDIFNSDILSKLRADKTKISINALSFDVRLSSEPYRSARRDYEEALRIDSKSIGGYIGLGLTYLSQQRATEALGYFEEALKIDSNIIEIYNSIGIAYEILGDKEEEEGHPFKAHDYYKLGVSSVTEGIKRDEKALKLYERRARIYKKLHKMRLSRADRDTYKRLLLD